MFANIATRAAVRTVEVATLAEAEAMLTAADRAGPHRVYALATYASVEAAREGFAIDMENESCVDNFRFAFNDDAAAVAAYEAARDNGCCGSTDRTIVIAGRLASIGCNYGH